jgi:hypothetical protein
VQLLRASLEGGTDVESIQPQVLFIIIMMLLLLVECINDARIGLWLRIEMAVST